MNRPKPFEDDESFLNYVSTHCETPVAGFHTSHIAYLMYLAGNDGEAEEWAKMNNIVQMHEENGRRLVELARERISQQRKLAEVQEKMGHAFYVDVCRLEDELKNALEQATKLAVSLREKHYPDVQGWRPLPDLQGVLSQIDNMTTELIRKPRTTTPIPPETYITATEHTIVIARHRVTGRVELPFTEYAAVNRRMPLPEFLALAAKQYGPEWDVTLYTPMELDFPTTLKGNRY